MTTNPAKEEFVSLLESTGRKGVDSVVDYLGKAGFFHAPASVNRHLSHDGGLLEHSLNVYKMAVRLRVQMVEMRPGIESRLPEDSVAIAALLHDVCKANIYKKVTKYRKDAHNRWESYDGYAQGLSESAAAQSSAGTETSGGSSAARWHTVVKGESLWSIAAQYNRSLNELIALNPQIKNPNLIQVGEKVRVA